MNPIFTIGHSDHALETFLDLLARHRISALADVRSSPCSQRQPQYARRALAQALANKGIAYVFVGEQLGGRPSVRVRSAMKGSGYVAMAATDAFGEGIERVMRGSQRHRIALMCAERDPLECHRALMVGRVLAARGAAPEHILADGRVEQHAELELRLMAAAGRDGSGGDLFATAGELLDLAYLRQEKRVSLLPEDASTS